MAPGASWRASNRNNRDLHKHVKSLGGGTAKARPVLGPWPPRGRPTAALKEREDPASVVTDKAMFPDEQRAVNLSYEMDERKGLKRIKYEPNGWCYWDWEWQGEKRKVHYIRAGKQGDPVVVLVHGYGASSYHWRYNVPALAEAGYQVYAVDLLGFGYSEKARVDYTNGEAWSAQVSSFVRQVVGPAAGPVVLAGNSLGGYVSLATAATHGPELVRAVALLNGAGPFQEGGPEAAAREAAAWEDQSWWARAKRAAAASAKRAVMYLAFMRTKQPERIREVLQMVYVDHSSIDEDLVTSIQNPAQDPAASEVFFLVSHSTRGPPRYVDGLLQRLRVPLLLLWGDKDPWITPARAAKIQAMYPAAVKVGLDSGHCPHDDTPAEANQALLEWLASLPPAAAGGGDGGAAAASAAGGN